MQPAQYMTSIQNLPQLSLKCHLIHPGIHKDHSITDLGLPTIF